MMATWLQRQAACLGQEAQALEASVKLAAASHSRPPQPAEDVLAGEDLMSVLCLFLFLLHAHLNTPDGTTWSNTLPKIGGEKTCCDVSAWDGLSSTRLLQTSMLGSGHQALHELGGTMQEAKTCSGSWEHLWKLH